MAGGISLSHPVDADLSHIIDHFMLWMLVDEQDGTIRFVSKRGKTTIEEVAALYRRKLAGETIQKDEWWSAWRSADAEVAEAAEAAEAAEEAAAEAVAAYAAEAAHAEDAEAIAKAAAYAAEAAAAAVEAAAEVADDDAAAAAAVRKDFYGRMADKLLELLAAAPVIDADSLWFPSNPVHM